MFNSPSIKSAASAAGAAKSGPDERATGARQRLLRALPPGETARDPLGAGFSFARIECAYRLRVRLFILDTQAAGGLVSILQPWNGDGKRSGSSERILIG